MLSHDSDQPLSGRTQPFAEVSEQGLLPIWWKSFLFGALFFIFAEAGSYLAAQHWGFVNFWLPAGLYPAVLLLNPTREWPWLAAGAFLGNFLFDFLLGTEIAVIPGFYAANTLQALTGAWLVRRFVAEKPSLRTLNEFWGLFGFAALLSPVVGATIATATLTISGMSHSFVQSWERCWSTNAMAVLMVSPFILVWFSKSDGGWQFSRIRLKVLEGVLAFFAAILAIWYILTYKGGILTPYKVWLVPFLLYAGLRLGRHGATAMTLLIGFETTFLTTHFLTGLTPAQIASGEHIFLLYSLLTISPLIGLLPALVLAERDQATVKLAETERRFRMLIDHANDAIEVIDPATGRFLDVNEKACKFHGYTREEYLALTVAEIDPPVGMAGKQAWETHVAELKRSGFMVRESFHRRKNGSVFPVEINVSHVRLERDYLLAVVRDIAERKRTEQHIRRLNRVYAVLSGINELIVREKDPHKLLEAACRVAVERGEFRMVWVGMLDPAAQILKPVASAGVLDGYLDAVNIDFKDATRCIGPSGQAFLLGECQVCNDVGNDPRMELWREAALQRGYLAAAAFPLKVADRVIGIFSLYASETDFFDADELRLLDELAADIGFGLEVHQHEVERRQMADQLRQSQKMEAVGQLAGGVAHDFNNILTAITMQAELCADVKNAPDQVREGLQQIRANAERAANLTRQLLMFSRKQVMQARDLDLNDLVTQLAKMLRRLIGEDVQLQLHLHAMPLITHADPGMLDQLLMNLAVNARDAMPHGGRLLIETAARNVDENFAGLHADARPGRYVCLRVSDTGAGIPPDILPRIFEPFFTTKEPGKGTGLGLATVFGIVKQHRGFLAVESEPGRGACFQIFLPASQTAPESQAAAVPKPKPRGGTETILLVEDDPGVRSLSKTTLEWYGYRVLEFANGAEALKSWEQHCGTVALLLTDMVMPAGVSGLDLARRLRQGKPDLKVIFISGYSAEVAGRQMKLNPGENFLQKPFPPDQLAETIRRSLDG